MFFDHINFKKALTTEISFFRFQSLQDDSRYLVESADEELVNADDDDVEVSVNELVARRRDSSRKNSAGSGINNLPPRPENPTPPKLPKRPSSAAGQRYIPADAGNYLGVCFYSSLKD